jgi:hypothetical protein
MDSRGWTVRGSNPGGVRFVQTDPGAHPASCTMDTGSFLGIKCGRGLLLTTHPFQCRGLGRVELYLYPPSGSRRACNGVTLLYFTLLYFTYNWTNKVLFVKEILFSFFTKLCMSTVRSLPTIRKLFVSPYSG